MTLGHRCTHWDLPSRGELELEHLPDDGSAEELSSGSDATVIFGVSATNKMIHTLLASQDIKQATSLHAIIMDDTRKSEIFRINQVFYWNFLLAIY